MYCINLIYSGVSNIFNECFEDGVEGKDSNVTYKDEMTG